MKKREYPKYFVFKRYHGYGIKCWIVESKNKVFVIDKRGTKARSEYKTEKVLLGHAILSSGVSLLKRVKLSELALIL